MIHTVCARARFCCIEHVVVDCAEPVTLYNSLLHISQV